MDSPRSLRSRRRSSALWRRLATASMICLLALVGCASTPDPKPGLIGKTLEAIGVKKSFTEAVQTLPKSVPLQLLAGTNLNSANDHQPLAVVVKVYRLRNSQRFEQAPFSTFLDASTERSALGDDLIGVSEIVMQPGQHHEITERLPPEAASLGIVALFRAPAPGRWRFSFDAGKAARDGVIVGLHACALTTSSASLESAVEDDPLSLAAAHCASG